MQYESWEALAAKAEWEGGIAELVLSYGLQVHDLPPSATNPELYDALTRLIAVAQPFAALLDEVEGLLPDD